MSKELRDKIAECFTETCNIINDHKCHTALSGDCPRSTCERTHNSRADEIINLITTEGYANLNEAVTREVEADCEGSCNSFMCKDDNCAGDDKRTITEMRVVKCGDCDNGTMRYDPPKIIPAEIGGTLAVSAEPCPTCTDGYIPVTRGQMLNEVEWKVVPIRTLEDIECLGDFEAKPYLNGQPITWRGTGGN